MFRKHGFTLSVVALVVLGLAVTARAADSAAPSYPDWAAAVVPAYPHARPWSSPIAARVQSKMYGLATTDPMPTVVAWYKARQGRMVVKRRRKYLVCEERRCTNPDLKKFLR
jgi:hypothetical protein